MSDSSFVTILFFVILIFGGWYVITNYSSINKDYACTGITKNLVTGSSNKDQGKLRISNYRFWVYLWSENPDNDGHAVFASRMIPYVYSTFIRSGEEPFATYIQSQSVGERSFVYRSATGEVGIRFGSTTFIGTCNHAEERN